MQKPLTERRPALRIFKPEELEANIQPQGYLVKGLLPRRGIGVLWGMPMTMKTFWTIDVCMHIATGTDYHGRKVEQGDIVYCCFEGVWGMSNRLKAYSYGHQRKLPSNFYILADSLSFSKRPSEGHMWLIESIKDVAITPKVVVLDTLAQSLVGSENKDEDMGFYLRAAKDIATAFDCIVIIIHHTGKDGSIYRGHSSLEGNADFILSAQRSGEPRTASDMVSVTTRKMKDGPEGEVAHSWVRIIKIGTDDDGDDITSCYLVPAPPPSSAPRFSKASKQTTKAMAILEEMWLEYGPDDVTLDMWKAACRTQKIAKGNDVAQSKAYHRALDFLRDAGYLTLRNHKYVVRVEGDIDVPDDEVSQSEE